MVTSPIPTADLDVIPRRTRVPSPGPCATTRPTTGTIRAPRPSCRGPSITAPPARRPTRPSWAMCSRRRWTSGRRASGRSVPSDRRPPTRRSRGRSSRRWPSGAGRCSSPSSTGSTAARDACRSRPTPRSTARRERMLDQARHFATLAPNVQVKFPVTEAGLAAIEQATYEGISINATVSFTVPQALAVGEAVERALRRREAEGKDVSHMSPVCTLMIGRLDDWVKVVCERDDIIVDPAAPNWAGIAVFKKAAADLSRARLPLPAAGRRVPAPSPLVGAHRWGRGADDPLPVGAALRGVHGRGPEPVRRPRARRSTWSSCWTWCRTSGAPGSPMGSRSPSSTALARPCGPCGPSSPATGRWSARSTSCCYPTRTCGGAPEGGGQPGFLSASSSWLSVSESSELW